MRFLCTIVCVIILVILSLNSAFGQEGKLKNLDSLKNSFVTPLSYSELFDTYRHDPLNQRKIQSFNFLKEYEVRFYDVSRYYYNTSNLIPYNITYEKPALYYHLIQDHIVIKKRKK